MTIFSGLLPLCDADDAEMDEDSAFPQPPKIPAASKRQKNTANIRLSFFMEMRPLPSLLEFATWLQIEL
ncbi:hypothetical protein [Faecalibacterium prausnitzii]|uniref:hypothetical protein n=1 Tax=Faecalibacterium prausnitzii TaxID=853 RepID=UPI001CC12194|nr:hypothetical protein [Faecalibacterium prausnitzii]